MNSYKLIFIIMLYFMSHGVFAHPRHIMSTDELLHLAEKNSQSITTSQLNVIVKQKAIDIAKARLYPVLNAEAMDSVGFPGSSAWLGVEGLVGSPYRSGATGGVVARQLLFDFGRTAAEIKTAQSRVNVAEQTTRVTAYEVKLLALQVFYQCATFKKQRDLWKVLAKESSIINKEAKHFVKTGQRSIVDIYLSDSQTEEAHTAHAFYGERVRGTMKELAVITGISDSTFECPSLSLTLIDGLNSSNDIDASPYVKRAEASAIVAKEKLLREKTDLRPKVVAIASAGAMEKTHLIKNENVAAGLGIIVPLFDYNINTRINRAHAEVLAKQQNIEAQKQFIEEMNAKLDETIMASLTRIKHLNIELTIAQEGFKVAKYRYFHLEGTLVDLREAWRNLARAETTIEEAKGNLLQARGAKSLLNGRA